MEKGAKIWEKGREGRTWDFASAPRFTIGFFLRWRDLRVDNNNKFSRQLVQVTFEMLQMSQVHPYFSPETGLDQV